ncbi:MAG: type IX secretion system membrane protein PorP/SprF [Bacteroidetes bacterium]|nr:MAG: type IX secretion system membrane protein PorP/SprF [Bacteroidota bacterium]MBL1144052.1 type IX secretion system membrane protein PorP/SprF [Bacteroidota bacterium]MCB0803971.1 type IX secretion system membrane protein PorP/SprF [Flavobacteriales bacterium]NOG56852.1 type IX secretion system membrane protein PorP/SprF [Bacteroidota bacterium]
MLKRFKYTTFFFFLISFCYGQDPTFSQFYANRLYLNPAFAGTAKCPKLSLNYRNQWPGIDNSFITYAASFDQQIDAIDGGLGVQFMSDRAGEGVLKSTSAAIMYSYEISVNRKFSIRAGLQGTVVQKSIDVTNLRFGDMIDARRGFIYQSQEQINDDQVIYPDFSFGLIGFSKKTYFGFAIHHLTNPNEGIIDFSLLPRRYTGHFGAVLPTGIRHKDITWSPNVIYQSQGGNSEVNLGVYFTKGPLVLGVWNRVGDAFTGLLGLETDEFKIGYSYDMTTSLLSDKTGGSHEISFSYIFPCRPKKVKFQTISCPSF